MLLIPCPNCGLRAEIEFRYAGEAHITRPPDPNSCADQEWTEYLYMRTNSRGRHLERWRHIHGCGRFFNVVRNTLTDRIEASYPCGESAPEEPIA